MLEAFSIFRLGLTDLLLVGIRGICWMTEVTSISLKAHLFTFGYNKALGCNYRVGITAKLIVFFVFCLILSKNSQKNCYFAFSNISSLPEVLVLISEPW